MTFARRRASLRGVSRPRCRATQSTTMKRTPSSTGELIGHLIVLALLLVIAFAVNCCSSVMEARAYNRVTGKNVGWWDAMWIDLRAESEAR